MLRERPGDEAGAAIVGEVGPGPTEQDGEAVAEPDQEENVDEEPGDPGDPAPEADAPRIAIGVARRGSTI